LQDVLVHVSDSPATALAERFVEVVNALPHMSVAVSGGSTPRELFRILAGRMRDAVRWEGVQLFQVDERCVPPDDAESNWRMLEEELLTHLPQIEAHRMEAEGPGADERYEALLRQHVAPNAQGVPELDLVLLGMGPDGHTASLFPGTDALAEQERLVVVNRVPQLDTTRVTMTFPLLQAARRRWFLVRGADKAPAFAQVRTGSLPAGLLSDCEWFIDPAVAQEASSSADGTR